MTGERVSANGEDSERTSWGMTMSFEGVSPELWRMLTGIEPTPIYDRVLAEHQERWRIARDAQEDSEPDLHDHLAQLRARAVEREIWNQLREF